MTDLLQPVSERFRKAAVLGCFVAGLVAWLVTILVVAGMIKEQRLTRDGKPLWIAALVLAVIAVALAWLTVRLWVARTSNGVTILPIWFIELFGAFFLAGTVWVSIEQGLIYSGITTTGAAISMLLVRRAIRKRTMLADMRESDHD